MYAQGVWATVNPKMKDDGVEEKVDQMALTVIYQAMHGIHLWGRRQHARHGIHFVPHMKVWAREGSVAVDTPVRVQESADGRCADGG